MAKQCVGGLVARRSIGIQGDGLARYIGEVARQGQARQLGNKVRWLGSNHQVVAYVQTNLSFCWVLYIVQVSNGNVVFPANQGFGAWLLLNCNPLALRLLVRGSSSVLLPWHGG